MIAITIWKVRVQRTLGQYKTKLNGFSDLFKQQNHEPTQQFKVFAFEMVCSHDIVICFYFDHVY